MDLVSHCTFVVLDTGPRVLFVLLTMSSSPVSLAECPVSVHTHILTHTHTHACACVHTHTSSPILPHETRERSSSLPKAT